MGNLVTRNDPYDKLLDEKCVEYRYPVCPYYPVLFQSRLTDLMAGTGIDHQGCNKFLATLELNLLNCLEQYGYVRGQKLCAGYIFDFYEAQYHHKEKARARTIKFEQRRQYWEGKREREFEENPSLDAY